MPHSVIQQVHLLALKDKMPLLRQQSLIFERRSGVSLDPVTLQDEAVDLLAFGDDGDDEDYDPANPLPDVPLLHDNVILLNELHDLHLDAASLASSNSSEEDFSVHSSDSSVSDTSDDSISSDEFNFDAGDDESTVTSVSDSVDNIVAPVHEPSSDPPIVPAPLDISERMNDRERQTEKGGAQTEEGGAQTQKGGVQVNQSQIRERGANRQEMGDQLHASHEVTSTESSRYILRNRADLTNKTRFNKYFDNPASQQSYSPHLQFFQKKYKWDGRGPTTTP